MRTGKCNVTAREIETRKLMFIYIFRFEVEMNYHFVVIWLDRSSEKLVWDYIFKIQFHTVCLAVLHFGRNEKVRVDFFPHSALSQDI